MLFIMLFTALFGRVWCGWACPQTVFMEFVFRKIEILTEGDHNARRRLDAAPWTAGKIAKKTAKHALFFLVSFAIANTFLVYFIGKDELLALVTDDPRHHLGGLAAILLFTGVFYAVFAYVREIVCTVICPYGRLQGVLYDKKTVQVAYDYVRGEPRGKRMRNSDVGLRIKENPTAAHPQSPIRIPQSGDCVDCTLCVQVCPTGIDIRNGSQLECIGCTACMDACDEVMVKIERPKGLIRYASTEGIERGQPLRFTGRMRAYTAVLLALLGVLAYLLLTRSPLETTVLRTPGLTYQQLPDGTVSNLYSVEIVNKTSRTLPLQLRVADQPAARLDWVGAPPTLAPGEVTKGTFFIKMPGKALPDDHFALRLDVLAANGEVIDHVSTKFLGPVR
jgi:cytochrome c oxidase accessory protein FixG